MNEFVPRQRFKTPPTLDLVIYQIHSTTNNRQFAKMSTEDLKDQMRDSPVVARKKKNREPDNIVSLPNGQRSWMIRTNLPHQKPLPITLKAVLSQLRINLPGQLLLSTKKRMAIALARIAAVSKCCRSWPALHIWLRILNLVPYNLESVFEHNTIINYFWMPKQYSNEKSFARAARNASTRCLRLVYLTLLGVMYFNS